jgi:hypothetical protein
MATPVTGIDGVFSGSEKVGGDPFSMQTDPRR